MSGKTSPSSLPGTPLRLNGRRAAWIGVRLLLVYLASLWLFMSFPTAYPGLCLRLLQAAHRIHEGSWRIETADLNLETVDVHVVSRALTHFTTAGGSPLGEYTFDGSHRLDVMNIYPVVFLTLFLGLPATLRTRMLALVPGLLVLFAAGALELAAIVHFLDAQALSTILPQVSPSIARTPDNLAWFEHLKAQAARSERFKAFFSSGGRQGLPVVAVVTGYLIAAAFRPRKAGREPGAIRSEQDVNAGERESSDT